MREQILQDIKESIIAISMELLYLIPIITSFVSLMTPLGQSWWS